MKKKINLSIVCATHNRPVKLSKMVESFNKGKILPKELIICGTAYKDFNYLKGKKIDFDLKYLISKKKNQIIQRRKAIQFARNDFILQIDDDVIVEKNFILNLEKYTRSKKKTIISALILTNQGFPQALSWNIIYQKYFIFKIIIRILNGFKTPDQYSILASGRCIPYIVSKFKGKITNLQWLCSTVMYHRDALRHVKYDNYLDKTPKSYYDDVFFSHQLYQKNYQLIIDCNVKGTHSDQTYTSVNTYFKTISTQFKLVKLFKKNFLLFFLDVILFSFIHLIRDVYIKYFK